jgi:LCP family protein required for cell wall assembly
MHTIFCLWDCGDWDCAKGQTEEYFMSKPPKMIRIKKHKKKKKPQKQELDEQLEAEIFEDAESGTENILPAELTAEADTQQPETDAKGKRKKEKKPRTKKQKARRRRTLLAVLCVIVVAGILVAGNFTTILQVLGISNLGNFESDLSGNRKYKVLSTKSTLYDNLNTDINFSDENVINILFFGLDENAAREEEYSTFRPDTIMLISINLETESINIISIPRDSRVDIYGRSGRDKINSCFYYGSLSADSEDEYFEKGVECLIGTVSDLLGGIQINYYVGVDMDGVPDIIDTIGGVEFDVEESITLDGITVEAGEQVLDGTHFLQLARYRYYSGGDIDRVAVQQKLIKALFEQMTQTSSIMKLPKAISQTFDIINTNLSFTQITTLAFTLKDYDLDNLTTETMPGTFGNLYGISYWIINQSERVDFIYDNFGITATKLTQDSTYIPKTTTTTTTDSTDSTDTTSGSDSGTTTTDDSSGDTGDTSGDTGTGD